MIISERARRVITIIARDEITPADARESEPERGRERVSRMPLDEAEVEVRFR